MHLYALDILDLLTVFWLQAIPSFVDQSSQTDWRYPRNATTQYNARAFSTEEQESICQEEELKEFVSGSLPR